MISLYTLLLTAGLILCQEVENPETSELFKPIPIFNIIKKPRVTFRKTVPTFNKIPTSVDPTYRPSLIPTRRTYNTVKPVTVSPSGSGTLVTTLVADEQFSTLVAALQAANITEETLADLAPLTLFAPTNEAFAKIDNETLNGLLTSEDKSGLTNILLRHVVPGQAVRLPEGTTTLENAGGSQLTVSRSLDDIYSESVTIRSSQASGKILDFDIMASDGVIFSVDTVL